MKNIEYIRLHYVEKYDLLRLTAIDIDFLNFLLNEKLIPAASYVVESEVKILSPLGDETNENIKEEYFGKHILSLIEGFKKNTLQSTEFKQRFKENFKNVLLEHKDRNFAYGNIFDENSNLIEELFEHYFDNEWDHYCNGIYGICTLNATEKEIVEKEIIVKKLINFNKKFSTSQLDNQQKEELIELNKEFNGVTRLFAPYQREVSSRGKYLDMILKKNNLFCEIKNY
ncbi:DUF6058 family natural product biosynthesis protein [Chryseobacterium jejuense]|uniref:DUF6058 family natural product biosynthesis protein n=1 Tax=Chryseobacterium jejuense TaxID=445960 RepID=UPI001AEAE518|nr:DUF6058 family natural product biosynthesis protein [Chryseobacterium jejuense]MBP2618850.1 hypothetical protein [Chryseobacterium jejuense]